MPKRKYVSAPSSSSTKSSSAKRRRVLSKAQRSYRSRRFLAKYTLRRAMRNAIYRRRKKTGYNPMNFFGTGWDRATRDRVRKSRTDAIRRRAAKIAGTSMPQHRLLTKALSKLSLIEKRMAGRLPSKAEKRKMAGVASNNFEVLYRKFCGRDGDQQSPQLWSRAHGQLVLKNGLDYTGLMGTAPEKPEPYIDKISHHPFFHMDWQQFTEPWDSYSRLIGEGDQLQGFLFPQPLQTYDASNGTTIYDVPSYNPGLEGDEANREQKMDPFKDRVRYYGYTEKKIDLMPLVFHRKQLQGILEQTSANDIEGAAQTWAQVAPKRLTDKIQIKNFWLKFDFDTKFAGDEGVRNQIFVTNHVADSNNPAQSSNNGKRARLSLDNRVKNMYAKVRIIIGKREKFGTSKTDRVSLNHVLQADDTDSYKHGHSNEEVLTDLFTRRCKNYAAQSGITHVTIDDEDYRGIRIVKDEIVKLGQGHSTKHYNVFKGHTIPYMTTAQDKNVVKDIYTTEFDPHNQNPGVAAPTMTTLYNRFGHCDIKDVQLNSQGDENMKSMADKLCIPIGNDMFMYVLTLTRAASVRWRITSKMTYISV